MIFLFCLKSMEMQRGYNFVPEKMLSGIKSCFVSSFARFQGVNIELR